MDPKPRWPSNYYYIKSVDEFQWSHDNRNTCPDDHGCFVVMLPMLEEEEEGGTVFANIILRQLNNNHLLLLLWCPFYLWQIVFKFELFRQLCHIVTCVKSELSMVNNNQVSIWPSSWSTANKLWHIS